MHLLDLQGKSLFKTAQSTLKESRMLDVKGETNEGGSGKWWKVSSKKCNEIFLLTYENSEKSFNWGWCIYTLSWVVALQLLLHWMKSKDAPSSCLTLAHSWKSCRHFWSKFAGKVSAPHKSSRSISTKKEENWLEGPSVCNTLEVWDKKRAGMEFTWTSEMKNWNVPVTPTVTFEVALQVSYVCPAKIGYEKQEE